MLVAAGSILSAGRRTHHRLGRLRAGNNREACAFGVFPRHSFGVWIRLGRRELIVFVLFYFYKMFISERKGKKFDSNF